jgi:hypothetical protein
MIPEELELVLQKWQGTEKESGIVFYHLEDREAGYFIVSNQYERFLGCEIEQAKIEISLFFNFGFMRDLRHLKCREGTINVNDYDAYFAALDETHRLQELKELEKANKK